ncbi:spore protease YyaC [Bacillus sp. 1P10SD]|uniref:spore protease YyaC n=1 Tax=Bacillus sp. 1P10SD TaxID=3132265 RepID=UPI0039A48E5D
MNYPQTYNEKHPLLESAIPYNHSLAPLFIRDTIYSLIPEGTQHVLVACIGSNRISGDSLGPFVGTLLNNSYSNHLSVIGNLQNPLDAATLIPELSRFVIPQNSFVIAVDSVIGSVDFVHTIIVREGLLQPGAGLDKTLPPMGDCSIMGVTIDRESAIEDSLIYTNLHIVYKMATNIAKGISLAVRLYFQYPSSHPVLPLG